MSVKSLRRIVAASCQVGRRFLVCGQVDAIAKEEVEDVDVLRGVCDELNATSGIDKRPPNREAEFRVHDPDGNPIDLSKHGWPI